MRQLLVAVAILIALVFVPAQVQTWGTSGHRIVARIAAKNLSSVARLKVRTILDVSDAGLESSMANASVWPDRIDKGLTGTDRWHFVNVPVFSPFSLNGVCTAGECVTAQIDDMARRLRTNQTGFMLDEKPIPFRPMTQQQLAFLIHFVGDIHQPMHAVANGDRGGNCVLLTKPLVNGINKTDQLHGVWDNDQVTSVLRLHGNSEAQTASALFQRFKSGAAVTQGDAADWARESHRIALDAVYKKLDIPPHTAAFGQCATNIQKVTVTPGYLAGNASTVERRLMEGGIRLSRILNDICSGSGCKANP
jgi:hypothetical protein